MPSQRPPTSPSSLLWAHQLKREHGLLLNRMNKLEKEIKDAETRTKSATGTQEIAAIAEQVHNLTKDGSQEAMNKLREDVLGRFEDVGAEIEAVALQVSSISRSQEALAEKNNEVAEAQKTALDRIAACQAGMKQYEESARKLERQVSPTHRDWIRIALEKLEKDVKGGEQNLETMAFSIEAMEMATQTLKDNNDKLAEEVRRLADRPIPAPAPVAVAATLQETVAPIVDAAAVDEEHEENQQAPSPAPVPAKKLQAATKKTTTRAKPTAAPTTAPKAALPAASDLSSNIQVSPRAAKVVKKAALKAASKQPPAVQEKTRPTRGIAKTKEAATGSDKRLIDDRLKKPIVRSGRGWVEIDEGSEEEEAEVEPEVGTSVEPAKRRGRPAKVAAAPVEEDTVNSAAPALKRGPGRPKKGESKAAPAPRRTIVQPEDVATPSKKAQGKRPMPADDEEDEPPAKKRRGLTNIFSSTMSSSQEAVPSSSRLGNVVESDTSVAAPSVDSNTIKVRPTKRRKIVQMDD